MSFTPSARSGGRSRAILFLSGLLVLAYFAFSSGPGAAFARAHLVLVPARLLSQPWTLVTHAFLHPGLGALLSSALALWFFGTPVLEQRSERHLWAILAIATVLGGLAQAGLAMVFAPHVMIMGAQPAALALIAAFGVLGGSTSVALFGHSMRSSTCALLFLGVSAIFYLLSVDLVGLAGGAAGAGVGAVAALEAGKLSLKDARLRLKRWRIRRRYRVIPGGRDSRRYVQ